LIIRTIARLPIHPKPFATKWWQRKHSQMNTNTDFIFFLSLRLWPGVQWFPRRLIFGKITVHKNHTNYRSCEAIHHSIYRMEITYTFTKDLYILTLNSSTLI
jgi:hypothetical protein